MLPQGFFYEHALLNQQIGNLLHESRVLHCEISTAFFFLRPALQNFCGFAHNRCLFAILSTDLYTHQRRVAYLFSICKMSGGGAPLTLPSSGKFISIWMHGNEKCPLALNDFVQIQNTCVKMRETNSSGWTELAGYSNKIHQFLKQWPHRLKQIRTTYRIECLGDEDADKIPLIFLRSWDKAKAANAQDDFIKESFARSFQLAHMAEEQSFAEFYEATYKKMPGKLALKTADEVQWLSTVCILEYKFLGACDLQWTEGWAAMAAALRSWTKRELLPNFQHCFVCVETKCFDTLQ